MVKPIYCRIIQFFLDSASWPHAAYITHSDPLPVLQHCFPLYSNIHFLFLSLQRGLQPYQNLLSVPFSHYNSFPLTTLMFPFRLTLTLSHLKNGLGIQLMEALPAAIPAVEGQAGPLKWEDKGERGRHRHTGSTDRHTL